MYVCTHKNRIIDLPSTTSPAFLHHNFISFYLSTLHSNAPNCKKFDIMFEFGFAIVFLFLPYFVFIVIPKKRCEVYKMRLLVHGMSIENIYARCPKFKVCEWLSRRRWKELIFTPLENVSVRIWR